MATDELQVQTKIVKSVRRDGGYGRKCSNRFAIGVPDLLISLQPFAPCYIEVKDFGKVNDKFDRQIDVTEKQAYELELFSKPYEDARLGFLAVALVHRGEHRLVLLPREAMRLTSDYEDSPAMWAKREVGGYYNMAPMLRFWRAAQCRAPHHL